MNKISIAIHVGARDDSDYIRANISGYEKGLEQAFYERVFSNINLQTNGKL